MELPTQKLVHTFGALADLGQEITDSRDVSEMLLTSLHLLLGALAIRRGAILEYIPEKDVLRLVAARGLESEFPQTLNLSEEARQALLSAGLPGISPADLAVENPRFSNLMEQVKAASGAFAIQLVVPMSVRGELVGLVL